MDANEREVIDDLFGRIRQVESETGPRDADAEAHIRDQIAKQPAAPYYMAQTVLMQEQALATAQARIEELERTLETRPAHGSFLGGLFGGHRAGEHGQSVPTPHPTAGADSRVARYADPRRTSRGGGFLAGAAQTAMGVAGGVLLGNALASLFAGDEAAAAEDADDLAAGEAVDVPPEGMEDLDAGFFDEDF